MDKAMIDIGENVWVDVASILIVQPRTAGDDGVRRLPGCTVYLARPGGIEAVDGTDSPLDIVKRIAQGAAKE